MHELHFMKNPAALLALGKQIRLERTKRKISQEQLADLAEITRLTIGKVEAGSYSMSVDILLSISRALEVPLNELVNIPGLLHLDSSLRG